MLDCLRIIDIDEAYVPIIAARLAANDVLRKYTFTQDFEDIVHSLTFPELPFDGLGFAPDPDSKFCVVDRFANPARRQQME